MVCRSGWFLILILVLIAGCHGGDSNDDSTSPTPPLAAPTGVSAQASPGLNLAVTVSWEAVSGAAAYNLYWATSAGLDTSTSAVVTNASSPYTVTALPKDTLCWFAVTAVNTDGESVLSKEVSATPVIVIINLNDTGIYWFYDGHTSFLTDEPVGYEGQDASYGRDAQATAGTLIKVGGGRAGFDFTKLDASGQPLADQSADYASTPWSCVRDNVTGLVWEVKTDDGGLHDKDWTYSWYNSDASSNGGYAGVVNGGSCFDTENCDTEKYVAAVNATELCGSNDWRMPTIEELLSIVDYTPSYDYGANLDTDYFPVFSNDFFWSASSCAGSLWFSKAWAGGIHWGIPSRADKDHNIQVRLVYTGE